MDSTFVVIFSSLILTIISIIFFKTKKSSKLNLPPGKYGWPLYGETIEYISKPEAFMRDRMAKYSKEIFKTSVLGEKVAILCGHSGHKFLYSNDTKLFQFWMPPSLASALSVKDDDKNSTSSKLLHEQLHKFLKMESLQHFVPIMDTKARHHFETFWCPFQQVKVQPLTKHFTFMLTCCLFIKYSNEEQVKELAKPFFDLHEGTMSESVSLPFYSAKKRQETVQKKIISIIKERQLELINKGGSKNNDDGIGGGFQDLLTRVLITASHEIDEKVIAGIINSLLFASFYTISTAITFIVYYLADHPHVYHKVLQEHLEIARSKKDGELLNWKDIQKMKYSWNVACESMRLRPPALGSFREVLNDFTYAGFRVPKGWKVAWNVYSTHKDPKYFPDPEKFEPSRFEGNNNPLPPYAYVPFGGGPFMCGGKEYARIEILVFLHNLVTRFKFSRVNPMEEIIYTPIPTPLQGLPIHLQKIN
ncbi:beta-amyrin 6-beta-monooxygenase [Spinacia oleracea]|uniref:Beta-amyrin 6-beta-monooxygenase n=1 Tax=Spinacia oleracea TaxID=3562 RepID=A0A9R0IAR1_SPIOL|nr:beta-amyrin 6-beta-monooxygenase-like [Spinacia oleracea]